MNAAQVQVTITQGTETLVVNTTDAEAAFLGEIPSAVETMTGQWGQPTGRDHAEPGKLTITLILDAPAHPALDYESEITVSLAIDGRTAVPFWRGWIDDITVTRRTVHHPDTRQPVTTWQWDLVAGDVIARAAATRVNLAPYKMRQSIYLAGGLLDKIEQASPVPLLSPGLINGVGLSYGGAGQGVPRDVDNQAVLDLVRAMVVSAAAQIHEGPQGLTGLVATPGTRRLVWVRIYGPYGDPLDPNPFYFRASYLSFGTNGETIGALPVVHIESSAVAEAPRQINRGTLLNEVSLQWWVHHLAVEGGVLVPLAEPEERTHYVRNTTRQLSTSQHRVNTDYVETYVGTSPAPTTPTAPIFDLARSWVADTARPTRTLARFDIVQPLDPVTLEQLVELGERSTVGLILDNAPDDLDALWRVIGGTATVRAGEIATTFQVEPGQMSGLGSLTWDDIPRPATGTFADGSTTLISPEFKYVTTLLNWQHFEFMTTGDHHLWERP